MQISHAALMLTLVISGGAALGQGTPTAPAPTTTPAQGTANQPATGPATTTPSPAPSAPPPVTTASSMLKPSLAAVMDTLNGLKIDKWKKGSVREEAEGHVESLLKDLQTNLPLLISGADSAPGQLSASIPLVKHLDAFYDVMLRVEEASRVSAPGEQVSALQQSLLQLNQARLALDDHLQDTAAAQEKRMVDLQASERAARSEAQARAVAAAQPVPCKPAPPPAKKKAPARKPASAASTTPGAAKPAGAAPTSGPGAAKPTSGTNSQAKPAPAKPPAATQGQPKTP